MRDGLKGTTEFWATKDGESIKQPFRFVVSADEAMLKVWLEHRTTKRQWQTADLQIADFATVDSAIPQAKPRNYAARFAECMAAPFCDGAERGVRFLSATAKDGSRSMRLTVRLSLSQFQASLEYAFYLLPVALEPVDLLAAQVRDLQDEVYSLKQQVTELRAVPPSAEFRAIVNALPFASSVWGASVNQWITWSAVCEANNNGIYLTSASSVLVVQAGLYLVCLRLAHASTAFATSTRFEVFLNGQCLRSFTDAQLSGGNSLAPMSFVAQIPASGFLEVRCKGGMFTCSGSSLSITKI